LSLFFEQETKNITKNVDNSRVIIVEVFIVGFRYITKYCANDH